MIKFSKKSSVRKVLSFILAVSMVMSAIPMSMVFAADEIGLAVDIENYDEDAMRAAGWTIDGTKKDGVVWVSDGNKLKLSNTSNGTEGSLYNHGDFGNMTVDFKFNTGANIDKDTYNIWIYAKKTESSHYGIKISRDGSNTKAKAELYKGSEKIKGAEVTDFTLNTGLSEATLNVENEKIEFKLVQSGTERAKISYTDGTPLTKGGYGISGNFRSAFEIHGLGIGELAPKPAKPLAITNLKAQAGNGSVALSWDEALLVNDVSPQVTDYYVYRGSSEAAVLEAKEPLETLDASARTYESTGLENDTEYWYAVSAANEVGEGERKTVKATPVDPNKPLAPPTLKAVAGDGNITLTWNEVNGAKEYNIYMKEDGEFSLKETVEGNKSSLKVDGLKNGTTYHFYAETVNASGIKGGKSTEVSATPKELQGSDVINMISKGFEPWNETLYAEWEQNPAVGKVKVSYSENGNDWTEIDEELVRLSGNKGRADILGLKGNTSYNVKMELFDAGENPINDGVSEFVAKTGVFDRSGFAFSKHSDYAPITKGGYNSDGTVPDDAVIIYIDNVTKNTAKATQTTKNGVIDSVGLIDAIEARRNSRAEEPLIVRFMGTVDAENFTFSVAAQEVWKNDKLKFFTVKDTQNITFEGVGPDAVINGWGLRAFKSNDIEIRNLAFLDFPEDAVSIQGPLRNIWVHHNDFFEGTDMGGDKGKGDGSCDIKADSSFVTVDHNHFIESGKSMLVGQGDNKEFFVTIHNNWFDNSGSRHPRVRKGSVHVYNNYYLGNKTAGIQAVDHSSVFIESNIYENVVRPMVISMQGHDFKKWPLTSGDNICSSEDGGTINNVGNLMDDFSAEWFAPGIDDAKTANQGGAKYNNFEKNFDSWGYKTNKVDVIANPDYRYDIADAAGRLKSIEAQNAPPAAPGNVTVSIDENEAVYLDWNNVYKAESYKVEYQIGNAAVQVVENVQTNSYKIADKAESGKTYKAKVTASNGEVYGETSEEATVAYIVPSKPDGLEFRKANGGFDLSWKATDNASSYEVTVKKGASSVYESVVDEPEVSVNGLERGAYTVEIVAVNGKLKSEAKVESIDVVAAIDDYKVITEAWKSDFASVTDAQLKENDSPYKGSITADFNSNYKMSKSTINGSSAILLEDKDDTIEAELHIPFGSTFTAANEIISINATIDIGEKYSSSTKIILVSSTGKKEEIDVKGLLGAGTHEVKIVVDLENKVYDFFFDGDVLDYDKHIGKTLSLEDIAGFRVKLPAAASSSSKNDLRTVAIADVVVKAFDYDAPEQTTEATSETTTEEISTESTTEVVTYPPEKPAGTDPADVSGSGEFDLEDAFIILEMIELGLDAANDPGRFQEWQFEAAKEASDGEEPTEKITVYNVLWLINKILGAQKNIN